MGKATGISWCHHTFNPWWGCTEVSPGCDHCYAKTLALRYGTVGWGPHAPRLRTRPNNWIQPVRWNKSAERMGKQRLVFTASMADVFDNAAPDEWRDDLWELIRNTPYLTWIILTKRPQNFQRMLPADWGDGYGNVWLGVSVENQVEADRRIPVLLNTPAALRLLSVEPMLEDIDLSLAGDGRIGWVIVGGESGSVDAARPLNQEWVRSVRDQCAEARVSFFCKQIGVRREGWPNVRITRNGDDPSEWPEDLRIQETPAHQTSLELAA